jgi:hypothetical protein
MMPEVLRLLPAILRCLEAIFFLAFGLCFPLVPLISRRRWSRLTFPTYPVSISRISPVEVTKAVRFPSLLSIPITPSGS